MIFLKFAKLYNFTKIEGSMEENGLKEQEKKEGGTSF